ncbi:MAG TPA: CHAT domain-containing tetratricopeptide repeat protein [Bryobacteraceae bacterium]|nr:CHAT domain-containing tetratricopeptide repeat protein [Bryobacteraceae bacterium]
MAGRLSFAIFVLTALLPLAAAGTENRLASNSTIAVTLSGSEDAVYQIDLAAGQVADLSIVEKQGMVGIVSVSARNGQVLVEMDASQRNLSAKHVLLPPGSAQLRVRAPNRSPVERIFDLRMDNARLPGEKEHLRLAAEQQLGEGERIEREQRAGFLERAKAAYQRSLAIWERIDDPVRQADTLNHVAYAEYQIGDLKAALASYEHARDLWMAAGDRAGIATALQGMALVSGDTRELQKAAEWAREALAIRRALGDLRGQAETLLVLYGVNLSSAHNEEARRIALEALSLAQRAGDRIREAKAQSFLGTVEHETGNENLAFARHWASLDISREERDSIGAARALGNIAVDDASLGNLREASAILEQLLPIRKTIGSPNSYATSLYNLSTYQAQLGELDKARAGFSESLAIFQRSKFPRGEGFALEGLGNLYLNLGDEEKAEAYFEKAFAQWKGVEDRRGEAQALNSLGAIAARRNEFVKSAGLHRQSLALARSGGLQRDEIQSLVGLAKDSLGSGDAHAAIETASQALEIAQKTGDRDGEASAFESQGEACRRLGDLEQARQNLAQALALREATDQPVFEIQTLSQLATLERDANRLPKASIYISKALSLAETVGASAGGLDSKILFISSHSKAFDLAIDIAMHLHKDAEALELSERARARGLVDLIRQARLDIRAGVDPDLLARERRVEDLVDGRHQRLTRVLASPHTRAQETEARAELDNYIEEYQRIEAEIRAASPRYAALVQPSSLSASAIQKLLDSDTALVEFWLGEERSYAWLVTREEIKGFALPPRAEIEGLARGVYRALNARNDVPHNPSPQETLEQREKRWKAADAEFAAVSAELSQKLLAPVIGNIRARNLWVAGDGALEYVPLAALPTPGAKQPLIAKYNIVRLPSASVLAEMRQEIAARDAPRRPGHVVAVFADPVFQPSDERVSKRSIGQSANLLRGAGDIDLTSLPRLPFSREEANAIVALAPAGSTLEALDFEANRAQAQKPGLADYRILHFATHAFLDSQHPELSGIVLSMVDRQGRPQDGFLRLHEIYNLRLNADLVVLSACRTALGREIRSEGLVGLTRGFMYAGVPQVLASLWDVRDRATAELMRRFYEALLRRHFPPAAALREAQLSMLRDPRWSNPYYWAAFVMEGAGQAASLPDTALRAQSSRR